ncbi:GNAT family N-acetyltransferase [Streptomyces sp. NPDC052023]|uniref:GNAT family N-acetyltransferase n=1 Tax=Streptomyces sp. NPDC052023 TaxID=3365681 RepID=UPI0037D77FD4
MTSSEVSVPSVTQFVEPSQLTSDIRQSLAVCWASVVNGGGAVIPADSPLPPIAPADVAGAVDRIAERLAPEHSRLLVATLDERLAGWLLVRREGHPLEAHCGVVNHVQTQLHLRRRGVGSALMRRVAQVAREEMGLERLKLSVRAGLALEDFYRASGWCEVGRWPGALRLAPGDDRDEVLMSLAL